MGLTFHYSGQLRRATDETDLVEEVADICRDMGWDYTLLQRRDPEAPLYGIAVAPEGSEPLLFTFLPGGRLLSPLQLSTGSDPDDPYYFTISTKTQYAGADTHLALLKLLKYLSTKYFAHLEVQDEGLYWESGDETLLREQFRKYARALEMLTTAVSALPYVPGESTASLADRLEQILRKKLDGNEL